MMALVVSLATTAPFTAGFTCHDWVGLERKSAVECVVEDVIGWCLGLKTKKSKLRSEMKRLLLTNKRGRPLGPTG